MEVGFKIGAVLAASLFIFPGIAGVLAQTRGEPPLPQINLIMQAGTFDPLKDPLPFPDELAGPEKSPYQIVQFTGPVRDSWKNELKSLGAVFLAYIPDYAFIVRLDPAALAAAKQLPFVRWSGAYHPGYKLSPHLKDRAGIMEMSALFLEDGPALDRAVRDIGVQVLWTDQIAVRFRADISMARVLAFMPLVEWVEPLDPVTLLNDNDARILHVRQQNDGNFTNNGQSIWSYNNSKFEGMATGKGVIVAVQDSGVDGNHVDFTGKKIFYKSYVGGADWTDSMGHGTHVAGTVLGTGQGQAGKYAGMAPDAGLVAIQAFTSAISPEARSASTLTDAQNNGAYICTNSWGDPAAHGAYGSMAAAYDNAVRDSDPNEPGNQSMVVIFAAGNEGSQGIREPATAKNVITIGATGNNVGLDPDQIASFSSDGPTDDGRRKPDVMAPGLQVTSCLAGSGNGYRAADGTSMAAPGAAGAAAVIVQYYRDNNGAAPSPAMVKALMANGAEIMSTSYEYPGNAQGWGRINVQKSLLSNTTYQILSDDQKVALKTGEQMIYNASVVTTAWPLKVTLAWTDPAGAPSANRELVNNLDLELMSPSGVVYYGNNFTGGQSRPGGNRDDLNNLEGFYLKTPELGTWTIKVTGTNVPQGPQDYAIAFSGDIDVSLDFIDLQVLAGPTLDTAEPAEGREVTFSATIRNNGTLPAPGALYRFTVNERPVYNHTIGEFKENTTMNISAKWIPTRGKFTVRLELDPQNIIREKNESNNKRLASFEVLFHGLVVVSSAQEMDVNPGAAAVFNLDIKNSGNANDTYTIVRPKTEPPPGWSENLTASNVSIMKLSSRQVNLTIRTPSNATAGEGYSTNVVVTSEGNSSYAQTVNMSVKVKQVFGLNFTTDSPSEVRADPGQRIAANFTLANPGNGRDVFTLKTAVVGKPIAWPYMLNQTNVTMGPRSSVNISLALDIPAGAYANESLTLNISASSAQSPTRSYRIRTVVRQLFGTDIGIDGSTDWMGPGGNLTYRLTLKNTGNGNDTLMLKVAAPEGWTAGFDRQAAILAPRAESLHELSLKCPPGTLAGIYQIEIFSTGSGGNRTSRFINVTVTQVYKVSIAMEPANRTLTQGEGCEFTLTIGNLGNGNDTFAFAALNLPDGISLDFTPRTLELGPGDENTVLVTVATRNTTAAANHTFIFKVISQGKQTAYNTTQAALEVLALPVVIPPIVNPPGGNDTNGSGIDIPWIPILIVVVVIGAAGGAAAMARSRRKKPAWEPTEPARTPVVPMEAAPADPLGMSSWNGSASNYDTTNHREDYAESSQYSVPPREPMGPPPSPGTLETETHDLSAIKAECIEHEARMDAAHEKMDKLGQEAESQKEGPGAIDQYQPGKDERLFAPLDQWAEQKDLSKLDDAQKALDKLKTDKAKLEADQKALSGDGEANDTGPRFERPDWSPDEEPAARAPQPPQPPQWYEPVEPMPPPPRQAAPPPPPPVSKEVTELDELMAKLRTISGK